MQHNASDRILHLKNVPKLIPDDLHSLEPCPMQSAGERKEWNGKKRATGMKGERGGTRKEGEDKKRRKGTGMRQKGGIEFVFDEIQDTIMDTAVIYNGYNKYNI